jgi:hypothetical protein
MKIINTTHWKSREDLAAAKALKAWAMVDYWRAREKRARTKVRKYQTTATYYERRVAAMKTERTNAAAIPAEAEQKEN